MMSVEWDGIRDAPSVFAGGGEMGKLMAEMDWSRTSLGPVESWPQSLRTAVSLCLGSNFPISMIWGPRRVQIYNDGYWPICGAKHPESIGQDFKECWASAWPQIGAAFERAQAGETSFLENQRMFLDRNGYLEETFFTFSFSPIRDESGGVGGLFHPVTETTTTMLAERRTAVLRDLAARTSEAQSVEEACAVAGEVVSAWEFDLPFALVYLIDDDGASARLAGASGIEPGSAAAPHLVDFGAGEDPARGWPLARTAASGAAVLVRDLAARFGVLSCGPYPEPPVAALVLPLPRPGTDRPSGLLVAGVSARLPLDDVYRGFFDLVAAHVATTISNARAFEGERARAEALAELDRAKTAFFSNVSHEFRTPLTLMLGPLEDMLARPEGATADRVAIETTHRNALRLLRLVNSLLDFSRIEAGRVDASYEPTDLARVTADLASVFRSAVERAGLGLVVDCSPLPELVFVDRDMWEKIVLNLLSNALKFTFAGEIEVSLRAREDAAELRVRDTGVGIPSEELPRLFERFRRVAGTRGRSYEGSGIGLSLAHELVVLHGGEVDVESVVEGGTTFTVTIPLGSAHLPPELVRDAPPHPTFGPVDSAFTQEAARWLANDRDAGNALGRSETRGRTSRARILVADDNADMREYLTRLLESSHEVDAVADGARALETALATAPDLIVSDVMMPGLDGFALLTELRADARTRDVPFILLSARAGEEARVEGLRAGADDYLVKPFSAAELRAKVDSTLRLAAARVRERDRFFTLSLDMLCVADLGGTIVRLNPRFSETLGWSVRELLERPIVDFVHPDDRNPTLTVLERLRGGESVRECENRIRRKDGSYAWFSWAARPLVDEGVIYCVARDVTDRKRNEEAFRLLADEIDRQRRVFETALSAISDFAYIFDREGRFTYVNRALLDLWGLGLEEAVGKNFFDLRYPDELAVRLQSQIERVFVTGEELVDETPYTSPTGAGGYYEYIFRPVFSENSVELVVGSTRDISARKKGEEEIARALERERGARAQAEEASKLKDEFLTTVSHELRTPLNAILGWARLVRVAGGGESLARGLETIERNAVAQAQLIEDLLDISRVISGKMRMAVEPVDLPAVVQASIESARPAADAKNLRVLVTLDSAAGPVSGDPRRLQQVVWNLLSNAIKFTPKGGRVRVLLERVNSHVAITVSDSGQGIVPEFLPFVFDRFRQADGSTTRGQGGLGIGLALVRELVELHGGSVSAESDGEGHGATFVVQLPLSPVRPARATTGDAPSDTAAAGALGGTADLEGLRVLVVDDEPDSAELLEYVLASCAASVRTATSVAHALEVLEGWGPDIVVSDIGMPGEDGYELVRRMRSLGSERARRTPAIAVTAYARVEDRVRALSAGYQAHLTKPVDPAELVALVASLARPYS